MVNIYYIMSNRKSKSEWQSESNTIHNNEFEILDDPKNGQDNVRILHKKCGNILLTRLNNHLKRYCKYCSNKNKKTKEEWQNLSNLIHNNEFEILNDVKSSKEKVNILHRKCGSFLLMTMNNHINHKNGCKKCSKNSLKDNTYWINKSYEIWGDDYSILENVNNVNKKVIIRHNICKRTHLKSMNSFIHNKRGCPYCSILNKKYAENYIENFLITNKVLYKSQKTFTDLKNPKTNRNLYIDFWIDDLKIGIEVNGVQHYKPIKHWGNEDAFRSQIYRDSIKVDYFKKNNYTLITINNKKITKINNIWQQLQKRK